MKPGAEGPHRSVTPHSSSTAAKSLRQISLSELGSNPTTPLASTLTWLQGQVEGARHLHRDMLKLGICDGYQTLVPNVLI